MEKKKVIFASHTFLGGTFVVGSHHLANILTESRQFDVMHVSTPVSFFHIFKFNNNDMKKRWSIMKEGFQREKNMTINYVPFSLLPWRLTRPLFHLTKRNFMLSSILNFKRKLKENGFDQVDYLIIDQPFFVGIDKFIKAKKVFYRATDLYPIMMNDKRIEDVERLIIEKSNGLIATSKPVLDHLINIDPSKPHVVIENGVEFNHFSNSTYEPDDIKVIPLPRAVYVGAIDERLDLDAIKKIAETYSNLNLIIIGPNNNLKEQFSGSNVFVLGKRDYKDIPNYLNFCTFALLPLSDHPANKGRSPMKLYEYEAAGLPIVVKYTEELERRKDPYLYLYKDYGEMLVKIDYLIGKSIEIARFRKDIKENARKHSWEFKTEKLLEFLNSTP